MSGTYVLAAGGTGGHLFPAQALARELIGRGRSVVVMTDARGHGYGAAFPGASIETVPAASFAGGFLSKLTAPFIIGLGILSAFGKLKRLKPKVVVGFGGYPSLPVMLAASLGGFPTVLHEQNAVLGRVNRLIADKVTKIAASFPFARFAPKRPERIVFTGNPVRPEVVQLAGQAFHPNADAPWEILVFGGSQGARALSEIVPAALKLLRDEVRTRIHVVQQARPEDIESVMAAYKNSGIRIEIAPFFKDLPQRMAKADLVIARAGASTIAELATIGRPAILIPYPFAMDDHQTANAKVLEAAGAAWMLPQAGLNAIDLMSVIQALLTSPDQLALRAKAALALGKPKAASALADLVESIAA